MLASPFSHILLPFLKLQCITVHVYQHAVTVLPVDAGWASAGLVICHWAGSLNSRWSAPSGRGSHRPYWCPTWRLGPPGSQPVSPPQLSPGRGTVMSSTRDESHAQGPEQNRRHPRVGCKAARCCCWADRFLRRTKMGTGIQMKTEPLGESLH